MTDEPIQDVGTRLHESLIAGNPTAHVLIAEEVLPLVLNELRRYHAARYVDEQLIHDAITDAYFEYIDNPASYRSDKSSLFAFLTLAAYRNLLNAMEKASTRKKYEKAVEFEHPERNDTWEEELNARDERQSILDRIPGASLDEKLARIFTNQVDRGVCLLMLRGERDTKAFAELLGISGDEASVRRDVKRRKDRIGKVLQRLGKRLSGGEHEG